MGFLQLLFVSSISLLLIHCGGKDKKPEPFAGKPKAEGQKAPEAPQPVPKPKGPHWSYKGSTGPEFWGDLNSKWAQCKTGNQQSPVNLIWSRPVDPIRLTVSYESTLMRVVDNGHGIMLMVDPGSQISIRGDIYRLIQVHFHTPSEHTLSGKSYPIEIHFVHKNANGKLAVMGVLATIGKENKAFGKILSKLPLDKGKEFRYLGEKWNPRDLMPSKWHYYNYTGSLTTPPCSENVNWNVVNTPIEMSLEQINAFQQIYVNNNRPIQPLNGRKVINY